MKWQLSALEQQAVLTCPRAQTFPLPLFSLLFLLCSHFFFFTENHIFLLFFFLDGFSVIAGAKKRGH